MILFGSMHHKITMDQISRRVTGEKAAGVILMGGPLQYLGGGYWRAYFIYPSEETEIAQLHKDPSDESIIKEAVGIRLLNPDHSPERIRIVEQAIAILLALEYLP